FEYEAEFRFDRLRCLGHDHLDAVEQRQSGLDAADNNVNGIGEMVEELRLAAFPQICQQPTRDAKRSGEAKDGRNQQTGTSKRAQDEHCEPDASRNYRKLALRPGQAGARDAYRKRNTLGFLVTLVEILERRLDGVSA